MLMFQSTNHLPLYKTTPTLLMDAEDGVVVEDGEVAVDGEVTEDVDIVPTATEVGEVTEDVDTVPTDMVPAAEDGDTVPTDLAGTEISDFELLLILDRI